MSARPFLTVFGQGLDVPVSRVAVAAVRAGYAVVPVAPWSKSRPLCILPARSLKKADQEAQDAGLDRHRCGTYHAITDDAVARRVFDRLSKQHADQLNLAVVPGPSRLIVVDADTAASVDAFLTRWVDSTGDDGHRRRTPTVRTPGMRGDDGTWLHKDGGHYYYSVPDDVGLPSDVTRIVVDGWEARWGYEMSLVPPSVRSEGSYAPTGDVLPAPGWLLDLIHEKGQRRARLADVVANDSVASWSLSMDWVDLLTADGWTIGPKVDQCGCPTLIKPGGSSSSKSATAHEPDCSRYANVEGHGPLHVWTTDPPEQLATMLNGSSTLTKLQYVTATRYAGDLQAAMIGLGLEPSVDQDVVDYIDGLGSLDEPDPDRDDEPEVDDEQGRPDPYDDIWNRYGIGSNDHKRQAKQHAAQQLQRLAGKEIADRVALEMLESSDVKTVEILSGERLAEILSKPGPETVPTIGRRSDGKGLLYPGRVSVVAGRAGAGKTFLSLLIAKQEIAKGRRVVLIDLEDVAKTAGDRLAAIGVDVRQAALDGLLSTIEINGAMSLPLVEKTLVDIERLGPSYVALDSANALITMFGDPNDNAVVTPLYRQLWQSAQRGNYAMLVVDHLPNDPTAKRAVGAQSKQAAPTGTYFQLETVETFAPGRAGSSLLTYHFKDRPGGVAAYATSPHNDVGLMTVEPTVVDDKVMTGIRLEPVPDGFARPGTAGDKNKRDECRRRVLEFLADEPTGKRDLGQLLSSSLRESYYDVVDELVADGKVRQYQDGRRTVLSLPEID